MTAIRVKTHLESTTVHLPQLKPLVGKDVEIIVLEKSVSSKTRRSKPFNWKKNFGRGWPGEKNDGFEKTLSRWRNQDKPRKLPDE